jgi:hypothetical protein
VADAVEKCGPKARIARKEKEDLATIRAGSTEAPAGPGLQVVSKRLRYQ